MKKVYAVLCACVMLVTMALAGCTKAADPAAVSSAPSIPTQTKTKALLVVSFGTSYNDSRDLTIGAIEAAIETAFPDYDLRRAFTSQIIIDKLAERDKLVIDNVEQALDRAVADGIKTLIVQPTHLMNGYEYTDLADALENYRDKFEQVVLAEPLLTSDEDFTGVINAITAATAAYDDGKTAICFMGHGTGADSNGVYAKLQEMLHAQGYQNYYIGTVEATPTLEDLMAAVKAGGYRKVVLEPLMVVAGDHANKDMAGEEADSWKSQFKAAGYEVECLLRGLGELPDVQKIYVEHAQAAIDRVGGAQPTQSAAAAAPAESAAPASSGEEQLSPVSAAELVDGCYPVEVESDSSMFRIVNAQLTVKDGAMSAVLTLGGKGYQFLYPGTGKQASAASEGSFIPYVENAAGEYTYELPVEALNKTLDCAAFSSKKKTWYDRGLVFKAATLPEKAFSQAAKSEVKRKDGNYLLAVTLGGGSGRASVTSPAQVRVADGKMTATIEWSSPYYDYMLVDGQKYHPINTTGNAVFELPVAALDCDLAVTADTTAMSTPHEVEYTLRFDAASMQPEN